MKKFKISFSNQKTMTHLSRFEIAIVAAATEKDALLKFTEHKPTYHVLDIQEAACQGGARFSVDQVVIDNGYDVLEDKKVAPSRPVKIVEISECGSSYLVTPCNKKGQIIDVMDEYRLFDNELAPYLQAIQSP